MALPKPPSITSPIPNQTFYSVPSWNLVAPQGPLIVGDGLEVVPGEGTVIAVPQAVGVNSILAGVGISVDQPDGDVTITNTGVTNLQAGPNIQVSANNGTVVVEALIPQSVLQVIGTFPVTVTGSTVQPLIGVNAATTLSSGVVQLYNDTNSTSDTLALTAAQGKYLQDQISALVLSSSNLLFAGTINASTGLLTAVTPEGANEGFTVGSPLPSPVLTNTGYFVIVTVSGTFTPTGSSTPFVATKGDWLVSSGSSWDFLDVGFDASLATTTSAGIVRLSTDAETQTGTANNVAVTPASLESKISSSTSLSAPSTIASSLAVKNTYDVADAAIPKSFLTTKGAILSTDTPGQPFTVVPVQDGYYLQSDIASPGGVRWAPTGTVCTVSTGTGLTGGPITTTGTIALAPSGVSPAIYSYPASLNVDSYGRIVNAVGGKDPVTTDNFTALGSIVAGTGANTFGTLLSGSNNQILAVDTGCPTGLKWVSRCVGTVTTVNTGVGLTGGPVTSIGTICLADTDVIPGSYPNACICVDQQGRITSIAQGGVGITTLFTGPGLIGGPITSSGTIDLSNTTVTPGTYNNATVTVDAKGRITSAANGSATIPAIPCSCLTLPGELLTANASGAPTALPVSINDNYILTANSNCALGMEWAAPAQAPPGIWQESALNMNDLVWTTCSIVSGCTNQNPSFDNTVCCNVVCYRQLNTKVWEVAWKVSKFVTGGTTCGQGQYLYRLPPEVPLIDTSGCFQKPITDFCGIAGSGSDNTYCYVSDVNIQGWVRRADNCNATLLASVWDNCHFRVAAGASVQPMFTNSSWYAFAGATTFISSYRITYQSV
jgi:hypothetical protein